MTAGKIPNPGVPLHEAHGVGYRPEVDGLRALAVLPVILFHAGFSWIEGGYVGVDIFFVISGYLISSIIFGEYRQGRFSLVTFYERRARRILPALMLVMAVCIPFAWFTMMPSQLNGFGQSMAAASLFASNMLFWYSSGYFDSSAEEKPLLHTWSLGVEEQFYLVFPLLAGLLYRLGMRRMTLVFLVLGLLSFVAGSWWYPRDAMAAFYFAPARAWELLAGVFVALLTMEGRLQKLSPALRNLLSAAGLLLIIGAMLGFDEHTPFPSALSLAPVIGAALVIGFADQHNYAGRLLSLRWVVGIGLVSYSAYLWHQPLFAFSRIWADGRLSTGTMIFLSLLSLALAWLSWRFVENPFRQKGRFSRAAIFKLSLASSLIMILLGCAAYLTGGFKARLEPAQVALLETAKPSPKRDSCHKVSGEIRDPSEACVYFKDDTSWAVFGDSHAVEAAYALAGRLEPRGEGVVHLSLPGCPPALLYPTSAIGCNDWQEKALSRLEHDAKIKNVLLVFRYSAHLYGSQLNTYPDLPTQPRSMAPGKSPEEFRELLWGSLERIVDRLTASGKKVVILLPVPELGTSIEKNIWRSRFGGDYQFGTTRDYYLRRNRFILEKFEGLRERPGVSLLDPAAQLCPDDHCRAILDQTAMYFDDNHLSVLGADRILAPLVPAPVREPGP